MDCFALILGADLLGGAVCSFTNIPNFGQFFYMLVVLGIEVAIYFKTQSLDVPIVLGVLMGILMTAYLPAYFYQGSVIIIVLNFTVILYRLYRGRYAD